MCMVSVDFYECLSCEMISAGNIYERFQVFFNVLGILLFNKATHCAKVLPFHWQTKHSIEMFAL